MYKQNLNRLNSCLMLMIWLSISSSAMALSSDVKQPVRISADTVVFNKSKGTAVYSGNVVIIQGSLQIRAWEINIQAPKSSIDTMTAKGSPVKFQQTMDDGKVAKGSSKLLRYFVKQKKMTLDGDAVLTQNNDKFSSDHIEYSTRTGELKAGIPRVKGKKPNPKGRVNAIFYPSN